MEATTKPVWKFVMQLKMIIVPVLGDVYGPTARGQGEPVVVCLALYRLIVPGIRICI